jgi:hypothetical protein
MISISIENNIALYEQELEEMGLSIPGWCKKILRVLTAKGKNKLRIGYKNSGLTIKSGRLYKSIYGSVKNDYVAYLGILSKQAYKFIPQNYSAEISAKNKEYMQFEVAGNWVSVKSFKIPEHDYFSAAENYLNSTAAEVDEERVLQREIDKMGKL